MSNNDSERIGKILSELSKEIEPIVKDSQIRENSINDRLRSLQNKMLEKIKLKCSDAYSWYESNRNKLTDEDAGKNPDAQKYMRELQQCTENLDNGLRNQMMSAENKISVISEDHNSCSQSCLREEINNEDQIIKRCMKNCFENTFKKTDQIQNELIIKIDDALYNLNKI